MHPVSQLLTVMPLYVCVINFGGAKRKPNYYTLIMYQVVGYCAQAKLLYTFYVPVHVIYVFRSEGKPNMYIRGIDRQRKDKLSDANETLSMF